MSRIDGTTRFDTPDSSQQLSGVDLRDGPGTQPWIEIFLQQPLAPIAVGFRPTRRVLCEPLSAYGLEGVGALLQPSEFLGTLYDAGIDTVNEVFSGICPTFPRLG